MIPNVCWRPALFLGKVFSPFKKDRDHLFNIVFLFFLLKMLVLEKQRTIKINKGPKPNLKYRLVRLHHEFYLGQSL